MKLFLSFAIVCLLGLLACSTSQKMMKKPNTPLSAAIKSHGGKKYDQAAIGFTFRKRRYTFENDNGNFKYTVQKEEKGQQIYDVLTNDGFTRTINGVTQNLSEKDALRYGNSLNSVIYFAQLPYKLDDPAVRQTAKGTTTIKGKKYKVVEVAFTEEGGGTDHDDIFYYWVNQQTNLVDYLAYKYHVNGGGVRFRSAYNPRKVGGIFFQDYVNYKAAKDTSLQDLPMLFEKGELKELSKIELEYVRVL